MCLTQDPVSRSWVKRHLELCATRVAEIRGEVQGVAWGHKQHQMSLSLKHASWFLVGVISFGLWCVWTLKSPVISGCFLFCLIHTMISGKCCMSLDEPISMPAIALSYIVAFSFRKWFGILWGLDSILFITNRSWPLLSFHFFFFCLLLVFCYLSVCLCLAIF